MNSASKTAILPLLGLLAGVQLAAQSVTFAQLNDLALMKSLRKQTPSEWLEAQYALVWAVDGINRSVRNGKKVDFIVITGGFGLRQGDPASVTQLVPELARALDAALVPAVYVLPGEDDGDAAGGIGKKSYEDFVARLTQAIPDRQVLDLATESPTVSGIKILGLNNASFGNDAGRLAESNRLAQRREIERSRQAASDHPSIVFAAIPDLDDPTLLKQGEPAASSWHLDGMVRLAWNSLLGQSNILAVFSGHLHSSTRAVYSRDYSWPLIRPGPIAALKTWVCPPLAVPFHGTEPLLRGFWIATVTRDGKVSVATNWFPPGATGREPPDKSDKLAEGNAYEKGEDYDKAAAAYQQALSSKDDWVRGQAESRFGRMVKLSKERTWGGTILAQFWVRWWRDLAIGLGLVVLFLVAARVDLLPRLLKVVGTLVGKPTITIAPPQKGNEGAPVDEFAVQLTLALEDIQTTLGAIRGWQLSVGDYEMSAPGAGDVLPELSIGGVDVKAILAWLAAIRNLLSRRIEIRVWGGSARAQAYAVQRLGWIEEAHWASPPPGSSADVVEAAQQLAYCIMGQEYIR
jgi:hypothetical protein